MLDLVLGTTAGSGLSPYKQLDKLLPAGARSMGCQQPLEKWFWSDFRQSWVLSL